MSVQYEIKEVSHAYGRGATQALDRITLKIERGERLAVLGPNGSGKSTLLYILDGLLFPSSGSIRFGGNELTEDALDQADFARVFRQQVALLFQNPDSQLFSLTVKDELRFGPAQFLREEEVAARVGESAEALALSHLLSRSPLRLSAGEKKRVALASLLANRPDVLLLDEPTAGLDPRSVHLLLTALAEQHSRGSTIVTATHDIHLVFEIADRVVVLSEENRIVADGPIDSVMDDTALLERHNLLHEHLHRHGDRWHRHPHTHGGHEHH